MKMAACCEPGRLAYFAPILEILHALLGEDDLTRFVAASYRRGNAHSPQITQL
jgi:hypothetical protein